MYKLISREVTIDGENYVTYGVSCETASVDDISADKGRVEDLVELCNRLDLAPEHIFDVAEDFVCRWSEID